MHSRLESLRNAIFTPMCRYCSDVHLKRLCIVPHETTSRRPVFVSLYHPVSTVQLRASTYCRPLHNQTVMETLHGGHDSPTEDASPTAGIIIIGDEILKGRIQDTNSHFITQRLHRLGLQVKKITVIGDDLQAIASEVRQFAGLYTHVITSGGIGPTHDDVTFQAVAEALGDQLVPHEDLVAFIKEYFKTDDRKSPAMKMAYIPSKSVLIYGEDRVAGYKSRFPVVRVDNVTVLPGVPRQLERAIALIAKDVFGCHRRVSSLDTYLRVDELTIAPALNNTVAKFPGVTIGSYPQDWHSYYKTHLTFEAAEDQQVRKAHQHFLQQVDPECELRDYTLDTVTEAWPQLQALLQRQPALRGPVEEALQALRDCLKQYSSHEVCVCFNGGKDCLVVLHLWHALMLQHRESLRGSRHSTLNGTVNGGPVPGLQAVYITEDNAFPQLTQFVTQTINRYSLDCTVLPGPLKSALQILLQQRPHIKAVIMGTRSTDPYSESLSLFQSTDDDWPLMMRVHPILNWEYHTVWSFIRGLYLPYCSLYDRGYTSLGNAGNTIPNLHLLTKDRLGAPAYRPAYLLQDNQHEREGRT